MADEVNVENQEQVSEQVVVVPEKPEEKPDIHSSGLSMNKPSDGILSKISGMFKSSKQAPESEEVVVEKIGGEITEPESTEKKPEAEVKEGKKEEINSEEYDEIDPQLVDAGRQFGLSDEEIVKYAETDPLYLHKIRDYLTEDSGTETKSPDGTGKGAKDSPKALKIDNLVESLSEDTEEQDKFKKVLTPFVDEINALRKDFGQVKGSLEQSEIRVSETQMLHRVNAANKFFDENSKDFPELEKTGDLPKGSNGYYLKSHPAVIARSEIWGAAAAFEASGQNFSDALKNAFQWYVGKNAGSNAEAKLAKKLSKRQEKVTPKKQSKAVVKKYANEDDRKADVVKSAKKKAGVPVED